MGTFDCPCVIEGTVQQQLAHPPIKKKEWDSIPGAEDMTPKEYYSKFKVRKLKKYLELTELEPRWRVVFILAYSKEDNTLTLLLDNTTDIDDLKLADSDSPMPKKVDVKICHVSPDEWLIEYGKIPLSLSCATAHGIWSLPYDFPQYLNNLLFDGDAQLKNIAESVGCDESTHQYYVAPFTIAAYKFFVLQDLTEERPSFSYMHRLLTGNEFFEAQDVLEDKRTWCDMYKQLCTDHQKYLNFFRGLHISPKNLPPVYVPDDDDSDSD